MGDYKEDTNQDSGTIFFIILFFLFVCAFAGNPGNHYSASDRYFPQNEFVSGVISSHFNAIISRSVSLPDLQKYCVSALPDRSLNPFSIQDKLSDYNRAIAQTFILIQKTRFSIEPFLPMRLCLHLPSNKDDDLPVLS